MPSGDNRPHRRYNPLNDHWVLVSPHRTQRPWQGEREDAAAPTAGYDPDCYLCPGNTRANGDTNPDYGRVYVFDNDFPALLDAPLAGDDFGDALLRHQPVRGRCRVICYSPQHNQSLGTLPVQAVESVVDTWIAETRSLGEHFSWVQIFENRGSAMGASNPHPHGQVWALDYLPDEARREDDQQRRYFEQHGTPLLLDYAEREAADGERVILSNAHWLVVVPYWATWPFETLLLPRFALPGFTAMPDSARAGLASIITALIPAYDRLFDTQFPYSMGWHGAPTGDGAEDRENAYWQLHAHFYPPLLRSATVRKHMVGFEMLAEAQRDITPEAAAERLREVVGS